ncbi:U32 family peptidase [Carnobacterium maltaromaticum]
MIQGAYSHFKDEKIPLPFVYDAQIMVTSSKQINFWVKRGATGAVLAREFPYDQLKILAPKIDVPAELLVYGATCIHQSKRPLVENYFNFIEKPEDTSKNRGLFISEPKKPETHYSIYEDINGTHIFATNDLNLVY